ncbi:MAG TPA: DUF6624 domain-containing protein [Gemmatimonadales bacterium]|nr:DUF6624 domain-containing protein [Gemmatimonadales bacterium]
MRAGAVLLLALLGCAAPAPRVSVDSALQRELLARLATDQAIRDTFTAALRQGLPPDTLVARRMLAVDSANTEWLRRVVADGGWPTRSRVGEEGAQAAFLIVQHATHDTAFQARMLPLLERAAAAGEARGADVAMLADRIAVHRGGRQRYGTQAQIQGGRVVLDPIDDSAHVDERRAALGMPPLAAYVAVLESVYTARPSR